MWSSGVRIFFLGENIDILKFVCSQSVFENDDKMIISLAQITITDCPGLVKYNDFNDLLIKEALTRAHKVNINQPSILIVNKNHKLDYSTIENKNFIKYEISEPDYRLTKIMKLYPKSPIIINARGASVKFFKELLGTDLITEREIVLIVDNYERNIIKNEIYIKDELKINLRFLVYESSNNEVKMNNHINETMIDPFTSNLVNNLVFHVIDELYSNGFDLKKSIKATKERFNECQNFNLVSLRILPKYLFKNVILQETEWFIENKHFLQNHENSCYVGSTGEIPMKILLHDEIDNVTSSLNCSDAMFYVTTQDPITYKFIEYDFANLDSIPTFLAVPNTGGYVISAKCPQSKASIEVGCQSTKSSDDEINCIITHSINNRSRRAFGYLKSFYRTYISPNRIRRLFKDDAKKELLKNLIPQIGACVGSTIGCSFCYIFLIYVDVAISPGVCYGACGVAVGGSCTTLLSRGIQYKADQTVICSELFAQGKLSMVSFLADSQYGNKLKSSNPTALAGYQRAAIPIVWLMRKVPQFSNFIELVAQPWIRHMEYIEGIRPIDDTIGRVIVQVGVPWCSFIGILIENISLTVLICILFILSLCKR